MRLEEFVADTLTEIIQGVARAQPVAAVNKAGVNPYTGSANAVQTIEFDIELSTVENSATGARLGVFVGPLAAKVGGTSEETTKSVGRVRFRVPVQLPSQPRGA